jgi:hypothetical protein
MSSKNWHFYLPLDLYTNLDIDLFDRVSNRLALLKPIG